MIRCTMFFTQVVGDTFATINGQVWGWSEGVILDAPDIATAKLFADNIAIDRQNILAANSILTYIRLTDLSQKRLTNIFTYNLSGKAAWSDSEIPNTAVLFRLNSGTKGFRNYYLRGVPDSMVSEGGGWYPTPAYDTKLDFFLGKLTLGYNVGGGKPGYLSQVQGASYNVTGVVQTVGSQSVSITTAAGHTYVPGELVNIHGPTVAGAPQIRGLHRVVSGSAGVFTIKIGRVLAPAYADAGGLITTLITTGFFPFTSYGLRYSTHRNSGRPSFSPRGRKRAVR